MTTYTDASGLTDLMTVKPDGTGVRNVTKDIDLDVENAIWLANGRLVFSARMPKEDKEIYAISPDGTGLRQLTDNSVTDDVTEVT